MGEKNLLSYDTLVHAVSGATGSVVGMATFYPLDTVRCRLQLEVPSEQKPSTSKAHTNGYSNGNRYTNGDTVHKNGDTNGSLPSTSNGLVSSNGCAPYMGSNGCTPYIGSVYPQGDANKAKVTKKSTMVGAGTWREMQKVVAAEGVSGLYKGVVPVLQSLCASNFVYFYTFHGLRSVWGSRAVNGVRTQSAGRDLLLGAVAGAVNVMVTTPLWVVNTRLKMSGTPYNNLYDGLCHIAREEGVKELWAGAGPSLLLVANPALQFMMYESMKRRLGKQMSAFTSLLVGAMAKAVATVVTYPLQIAQAHLRHRGSQAPGKGAALPLLLSLFKERGVRGVFRGLEAKLLQTVLTAALMFATYEKIVRFVFSILHRNRKLLRH